MLLNYSNSWLVKIMLIKQQYTFWFISSLTVNWGYIQQRPPVVVLSQIGQRCIYKKEKKFLVKNPLYPK